MEVPKFLILLLFAATVASFQTRSLGLQSLRQGSSLEVEEESVLVSPKGTFSSGFYNISTNASCYSVWYTNTVHKTVVWMANRDTPVSVRQSKLSLQRNGNLVLTDGVGSTVWSTNTLSNASMEFHLRLLETGNLVLLNQAERIIWQSFDSPTDTLLPSQQFDKSKTLVSMRSRGTYLSGYYNFKFDGNNVLYLTHDSPLVSSVYWPKMDVSVFGSGRSPYNSSRVAVLDERGKFVSSDNLKFKASDYGVGPKRRLTLDYDGLIRMYSLDESTGLWKVSWLPEIDYCRVHGLCGEYGICTYKPEPTCTCPPGFSLTDPSDWSKGCSPPYNLSHDSKKLDFMELPYTDYYGSDLDTYHMGISFEECRNTCLNDTRCKGFGFALDGFGQCYPKNFLLNGFRVPSTPSIIHIKILKASLSPQVLQPETYELNCSRAEVAYKSSGPRVKKSNQYIKYLIGFVTSFAIFEAICIGLTWWCVLRKHAGEDYVSIGYMELVMEIKRFTYAELKRATKDFTQEIGKGGFGAVYKGVLGDGRVVAVKRLEGIVQGDAEFWAEVSVIGNINHRNLVKLWGFCAENEHKLLVYEYHENGSLDKILFSDVELGLEVKIKAKRAKWTQSHLLIFTSYLLHNFSNPLNLSLSAQTQALKQTKSMAATLSFLKLPVLLPHKPNYCISKLQVHPSSSRPNIPKQDPIPPPQKLITTTFLSLKSASLPLTALTLPFFLDPKDAFAVGGEFGILEGRTFALIHPVVMGGLFVYTLWAGYLGWQWRRVRTIQDEINELKKQEKPTPVTPDGTPVEAPPSPVSLQIKQLSEERKELVKGGYRDRHFNAGSLLLAFGVFEAIGGGVNTWLRTGKLFPGPHLFAGAGITVLWAAAAALVPAMQKGNETARSLHIALNAINLLLFIWQIPTGLDIVWKVFEFTKWP